MLMWCWTQRNEHDPRQKRDDAEHEANNQLRLPLRQCLLPPDAEFIVKEASRHDGGGNEQRLIERHAVCATKYRTRETLEQVKIDGNSIASRVQLASLISKVRFMSVTLAGAHTAAPRRRTHVPSSCSWSSPSKARRTTVATPLKHSTDNEP